MFADFGPPSQAAQPSFVEIPNPRVTTTRGRMEVTNVRSQSVTGRLLNDQDNLIQEDRQPIYVCVRQEEILCPTEQANVMSWWQLGEQAITPYTTPKKYSLESLINKLDGLNLDELYALRTFICLESDPFQAYSDRKWFVNHKLCIMRYLNLIPILCEVAYNREIAFMVRL
ncbi:hypothetical protein [Microcoleus sp. D3_18_C4]|uniref:hypothetical protein n=1 Tax=Microcoleus sp. D3_18_C4 TaxID=3055335 RepID=UPI002FD1AEF6